MSLFHNLNKSNLNQTKTKQYNLSEKELIWLQMINKNLFKLNKKIKLSKISKFIYGITLLIESKKDYQLKEILDWVEINSLDNKKFIDCLLKISKERDCSNMIKLYSGFDFSKSTKNKTVKKVISREHLLKYFWTYKDLQKDYSNKNEDLIKSLKLTKAWKLKQIENFISVVQISKSKNNYFINLKNKTTGEIYYKCSSGMVKSKGKEKASYNTFFRLSKLFSHKVSLKVKKNKNIRIIEIEIDNRLPINNYNTLIFSLLNSKIKKYIYCYNYLNKESHNGLRGKKKRRI